MTHRISRQKLARYVADQLQAGASADELMRPVAAYLVATGQVRSAALVVRAIEAELQQRGSVVATVTSARPLSTALQRRIRQLIGGDHVQLRQVVDKSLIGGLRIELPDSRFDDTIEHKLSALKGMK